MNRAGSFCLGVNFLLQSCPKGNLFGLQFLSPCPDTISTKAFSNTPLNGNKKWVADNFRQSLHPLPHTNPQKQVSGEREDVTVSKRTYCLPEPHSSLWVRGPGGAEGCPRQVTRGPEPGPVHPPGHGSNRGRGRGRSNLSTKFSTEDCPGKEVEVEVFSSSTTWDSPRQEVQQCEVFAE